MRLIAFNADQSAIIFQDVEEVKSGAIYLHIRYLLFLIILRHALSSDSIQELNFKKWLEACIECVVAHDEAVIGRILSGINKHLKTLKLHFQILPVGSLIEIPNSTV